MTRPLCLALASLVLFQSAATAGNPFRRRAVAVVPRPLPAAAVVQTVSPITTTDARNANAPTPMLGTFYSTPYLNVRGDSPTGGGYSPLGQYGTSNLVIYGPLSVYRSIAAPVEVYTRGYDGSVVLTEATAFSTPNLPNASRVIYPTPATNADHPRPYRLRTNWPSAITWIDQN